MEPRTDSQRVYWHGDFYEVTFTITSERNQQPSTCPYCRASYFLVTDQLVVLSIVDEKSGKKYAGPDHDAIGQAGRSQRVMSSAPNQACADPCGNCNPF